jgi:hypothetical protein
MVLGSLYGIESLVKAAQSPSTAAAAAFLLATVMFVRKPSI